MPGIIRAAERVALLFFAALDGDAQPFDAGKRREFGDGDPQPRRLEVADDELRNGFCRMFQQRKMLFREEFADVGDNFSVIDGVFDAIAVRGVFAAQSDFQIKLDGLRHLFFPLVDTDAGFDAQLADEYGVHGSVRWAAVDLR